MVCPGCGAVFCPEPPDDPGHAISPYCLPECRREARQRRAAQARDQARIAARVAAGGLRGVCPVCGKDRYATREAAEAKITARMRLVRPGRRAGGVYECGGWFHVTRKPQARRAS